MVMEVAELEAEAEVTLATRDDRSCTEVVGPLFSCWLLLVLTVLEAGMVLPDGRAE